MSIDLHPKPQHLMRDLVFPESPRWHDGRLWVSDWGAGEVITLRPDGRSEVVARVESFPCASTICPTAACSSWTPVSDGSLRREADGSFVTHADLAGLGEPTRWNDIVVDGRGNAYVNNIGFYFPDGEFAPGNDCHGDAPEAQSGR